MTKHHKQITWAAFAVWISVGLAFLAAHLADASRPPYGVATWLIGGCVMLSFVGATGKIVDVSNRNTAKTEVALQNVVARVEQLNKDAIVPVCEAFLHGVRYRDEVAAIRASTGTDGLVVKLPTQAHPTAPGDRAAPTGQRDDRREPRVRQRPRPPA